MKLGIIGLGNMSQHIIKGYQNMDFPYPIIGSSRSPKTVPNKILFTKDNQSCIDKSDIIMIGVRPEDIKYLSIHDFKNKPIISMAAKYTFNDLRKTFKTNPLIRIMPNLNVAINEGDISVSFLDCNEKIKKDVLSLLEPLGRLYILEESQISAFVGLSGSAPAIVYSFIDNLSNSTIHEGISKEQALTIVSNMTRASSKFLINSKQTPDELIKKISSKGGTTYEGMQSLENANFDLILQNAIKAIIDKDKKG